MSGDQLSDIAGELVKASTRLHRLVDALPDRAWTLPPARGSWSVAQCVEHLNLTSRAFVPRLRDAVARAGPQPPGRAYRSDLAGRMVAGMVGPMLRMGRFRLGRVKTPAPFQPADAPPREPTMAEFDALQGQLLEIVRDARGRAIGAVKVTSPFAEKLSYSVYAALIIIPRHQFRHLDQAEESARLAGASVTGARETST